MARKPPARPGTKRSIGRRVARAIIGLVVAAAMLAGAAVLVDMALRDFAETRAESEIKRRVPGSSVSAEVTINGFSMLQQVVQGELDDVDVRFTLSEEGLSRLAQNAGFPGGTAIEGGAVTLEQTLDVLGTAVPVALDLEPTLDEGGYLVLTAVGVSAADVVEIDLTQFVDLASAGIRVCSASLLPESIRLVAVDVEADEIVFTAQGRGVPTNFEALGTRGECTEEAPEAEGEGAQPAA